MKGGFIGAAPAMQVLPVVLGLLVGGSGVMLDDEVSFDTDMIRSTILVPERLCKDQVGEGGLIDQDMVDLTSGFGTPMDMSNKIGTKVFYPIENTKTSRDTIVQDRHLSSLFGRSKRVGYRVQDLPLDRGQSQHWHPYPTMSCMYCNQLEAVYRQLQ